MVRALRGAITVNNNSAEDILDATKRLLTEIVQQNGINHDDIISVIFSLTADLDAAFPAVAARTMGWDDVPLMCANEVNVPGSLQKCIRVLMHINSTLANRDLRHVYLEGAKVLRPDLGIDK